MICPIYRRSTRSKRRSFNPPAILRDVLRGEGNAGLREPPYTRRDDFARRAENRGDHRNDVELIGERRRRACQEVILSREMRALATSLINLRRKRLRLCFMRDEFLISQLLVHREGKSQGVSLPPLPPRR